MTVDRESVEVTEREREPGVYDLLWLSGPKEGYGFTTATEGGDLQTDAELDHAMRNFLDQVDSEAGYIE